MRYLLTGLGLFLLLTLFIRAWFVKTNQAPETIVQESPTPPKDEVYTSPQIIFSGSIILKDNLLLKPVDYQEIENVVKILKKNTESQLDIYTPNNVNTAKIRHTLRTILTDQGILETQFQFLRKQFKLTNEFQILMEVK